MEHEALEKDKFHDRLLQIIDVYVHGVYTASRKFPKDELYGVVSQLRRSALSVALNYIEGFARQRTKVHQNFLEISYGSLKESQYLLTFSLKEGFMTQKDYETLFAQGDEIARMLWGILRNMKQ